MNKKRTIIGIFLILVCALVLTGCSYLEIAKDFLDDSAVRFNVETMVECLMKNDRDRGYESMAESVPRAEYNAAFPEMANMFQKMEPYEVKRLAFYRTLGELGNEIEIVIKAVYRLKTDSRNYIIETSSFEKQSGLSSFFIEYEEKTAYYHNGTFFNMKDASVFQWAMLVAAVLELVFVFFVFVDGCRRKIKYKVVWLLLIFAGSVGVYYYLGNGSFNVGFKWSLFMDYTAFLKYGDGSLRLRLFIPVGAIIYLIFRKKITKSSVDTNITD